MGVALNWAGRIAVALWLCVITPTYGQVAPGPGTPAANFADDSLLSLAQRDIEGA